MARTARIIALGLASLGLVGSSLVAAAPAFGRDHSGDGYREVSGEACLHDWNHRQCKSRTHLEADVWSSHGSDWKVVKLSVNVDFFKRHDNRWRDHNRDRCRWDSRSSDRCRNNGDQCRWDSRSSDRCGSNNGGDKCRWDSRSSDRCGSNNGGDKCRWSNQQGGSDRCGSNNGGDKCRWSNQQGGSDRCGSNNGGDKCRWTNGQSDRCKNGGGMKPGSNDPNGTNNGPNNGPSGPGGPGGDPTTTAGGTPSTTPPTTPDTSGQTTTTGQGNGNTTTGQQGPNSNAADQAQTAPNGNGGNQSTPNNNTTANQSSGLPANSQACDNPGRRHTNSSATNSTANQCQTAQTGQSVSRGTSRAFHRDHVDSRDLGEVKFQYWNDRRDEWVTFAREDIDSHGKADIKIKVNLKRFHDHELKVRAKYSGVEDRIDGSTSRTVTID